MKKRNLKTGKFMSYNLFNKCLLCNKKFNVKPCQKTSHVFCSHPCYSRSLIGKKQSKETIEKRRQKHLGRKNSMKYRLHMSAIYKGSRNPAWRGGVTKGRSLLISTIAYKIWRKSVYERDNYTCQKCGVRGGYIQADHIIPWWKDKSKRLDVNNGQTLCLKCHREKTRKEMSANWINQYTSAFAQVD